MSSPTMIHSILPDQPGYRVWHGARHWEPPITIRPCRSKRYEGGPGLYASTKLDTARKYAARSGCLVAILLQPDFHWLEDTRLEYDDAVRFLNGRDGLRHREDIVKDLQHNLERLRERESGRTDFSAEALVNLCVLYQNLGAKHGPALAHFLVEHGIDGSQANPKYGETQITIYNPDVVIAARRYRLADTFSSEYDFPTIKEQSRALEMVDLDAEPLPQLI